MHYQLKNLLPFPLKEQKRNTDSTIWETVCHLEKGKKYLVTAPSGKGKSTFLHILYGLRKDYDGTVLFENKNITDFSIETWATLRKDKLAIVFQDLRLFPQLSALDNILIKANLQESKSTTTIEKMATQLDIEALLHQSCATLSYGQRQRVAIIRALCQPFDFLLLDEPFSHLDEDNTEAAFQLIESVCKEQHAGYVLVSLGERFGRKYSEELVL